MTQTTDLIARFDAWLHEARAGEINDPNAMTLATVAPDGRPSARIVLLKGADADGFVFYTNTHSRKGDEIAANARVALLFHWKTLRRQVRVEGKASPVTPAEADAYFQTRARISRLGAAASDQSRHLPARAVLEQRVAMLAETYPEGEDIPRPKHWSGFRVRPERMEFWQDMPFRLHDRTVYHRGEGETWTSELLYP